MSKFKVGDRVKVVRPVVNDDHELVGRIFNVVKLKGDGVEIDNPNERNRYMSEQQVEIVAVEPEPKYPIIEMLHGDKIVFNPPYTIVTCKLTTGPFKGQKLVGKAKCNPLDTYDKWTGFKIAHDRMAKATPCLK